MKSCCDGILVFVWKNRIELSIVKVLKENIRNHVRGGDLGNKDESWGPTQGDKGHIVLAIHVMKGVAIS